MNIEQISNELQWIERAKEIIFESLALTTGPKSIVIPGGSTALPLLKQLYNLSLPWQEISMYQSDERVTNEVGELNLTSQLINLSKEFMLQLHKFVQFNTDLDEQKMITQYTNQLPDKPFDLVILGMGEDGHIASLFNEEDCSKSGDVVITQAPDSYTTKLRVSLSYKHISNASKILLLTKGDKKLQQLNNSANQPVELILMLLQTVVVHSIDS
jgi:6-phosphogluconolactonase